MISTFQVNKQKIFCILVVGIKRHESDNRQKKGEEKGSALEKGQILAVSMNK